MDWREPVSEVWNRTQGVQFWATEQKQECYGETSGSWRRKKKIMERRAAGGWRSGLSGGSKPTLVPQNEIQQIPDFETVKSLLLAESYENAFDGVAIESSVHQRTIEDARTSIVRKPGGQHIRGRPAKPPLLSIDDAVRNDSTGRLPKDVLRLILLIFQGGGNGERKRNHILVQEWHSGLN